MSTTHGPEGKRKHFVWSFSPNANRVNIENENWLKHSYTLQEVQNILATLLKRFGTDFFPLANNVEWLSNGTEKPGLGTVILGQPKSNVLHAQGSSYLGVVLEECGYFIWNGKRVGIRWRLVETDLSLETLASRLVRPK